MTSAHRQVDDATNAVVQAHVDATTESPQTANSSDDAVDGGWKAWTQVAAAFALYFNHLYFHLSLQPHSHKLTTSQRPHQQLRRLPILLRTPTPLPRLSLRHLMDRLHPSLLPLCRRRHHRPALRCRPLPRPHPNRHRPRRRRLHAHQHLHAVLAHSPCSGHLYRARNMLPLHSIHSHCAHVLSPTARNGNGCRDHRQWSRRDAVSARV